MSAEYTHSVTDNDITEDISEVPEGEVDSVDQTLADELATVKDQLLRQAAEYQNFRRRTERERVGWTRRAQASVLGAILPVLDDFSRSLDAAQEASVPEAGFREGVLLVYNNLLTALADFDVKPMEVEGALFDEHLHEAILQVPVTDGADEGSIVQEVQRGYLHGDHVLRYAKVVVATPPEDQ